MSLVQLAKRMFDKRATQVQATRAQPARQDVGLPYGARIGSLMELPRASFAILDGTLLKVPASAQLAVSAVSRLRLAADPTLELFRLYTDTGDRRTGAGQAFLQVLAQDGAATEATYYQHLFRLTPTTAEEQAAYQGQGRGLGELWYNMEADQLALTGLNTEQIAALLGAAEALAFKRDTPGNDAFVSPFAAVENRLDDPVGTKGMRQRMRFMPYSRTLPDDHREQLLIAFSLVESVDGAPAKAVHVDFFTGLTLEPLKLKVI